MEVYFRSYSESLLWAVFRDYAPQCVSLTDPSDTDCETVLLQSSHPIRITLSSHWFENGILSPIGTS